MPDYIKYFETETEFNEERNSNYYEPWVSYTQSNSALTYNKTEEEKPKPLIFEITGDGNIVWKAQDTAYTCTIEYKKNDGEWTSITSATGSSAPSISVVSGDTVQFRGDNATYSSGFNRYNMFSGTTCQFKIKGNIMSLINGTDFANLTTLQSTYNFQYLFYWCTGLTDAGNLILPATTLAENCYSNMFYGCTSLTTAPALPATTLAGGCYISMFQACTSLTTAPELPATTLANGCYNGMFQGCTGLATAPSILPATTLAGSCYYCMFFGCTSLTTAPTLPATTLSDFCYFDMFRGCTSLTTAPELPATTLEIYCYEGMFRGCTSLTTAPELPATTLVSFCYYCMFSGCTNLNYIKCLATDISATGCTNPWVSGVASSGIFVKNPNMSSWTTGTSGIPTNWTVRDAE